MDSTECQEVVVHFTVGEVFPSQWLLKSGGTLTGQISFESLNIHGNLELGDNFINNITLKDALVSNSYKDVQGIKTFSKVSVQQNVYVDSVNDVSIGNS